MEVPATIDHMREILVAELLGKPEQYKWKSHNLSSVAIKFMAIPGSVPSWLFIDAFANVFKVGIAVHCGKIDPIMYSPSSMKGEINKYNRIHLQCLGGVHFNPVKDLGDWAVRDRVQEDREDSCSEQDVEKLQSLLVVKPLTCCYQNCKSPYVSTIGVTLLGQSVCATIDTGSQLNLLSMFSFASFDAA